MLSKGTLLVFLITLWLSASFGNCDKVSVEVVGIAECVDCAHNDIEPTHAFSGTRVAIICKVSNGKFKTRAFGELTQEGTFKVSLPREMVKESGAGVVQLKQQCFAQLLPDTTSAPPPFSTDNGLIDYSKSEIIFKSTNNGTHTFGPAKTLLFSSVSRTAPTSYKLPKPKILVRYYRPQLIPHPQPQGPPYHGLPKLLPIRDPPHHLPPVPKWRRTPPNGNPNPIPYFPPPPPPPPPPPVCPCYICRPC